MRKITKQMLNAYLNEKPFKSANTEVIIETRQDIGKVIIITLHGFLIAQKEDGILYINNAGWFTNVTKERLNALPNVSICQMNFKWYLNGIQWDGRLAEIKG